MSRKINVEDFYGSMIDIVKTWSDDVSEVANQTIKDVSEEAKSELKVAGNFQNKSGKYRKGWKITYEEQRYGLFAHVHNKVYQLTHLLESGHAKYLWGRDTGEDVQAFPHIEKVNEEAQRKLEEELARRLNEL